MLLISCVPEGWPSSAIHCDHIRTPPASIHHADAGGEMIGNPSLGCNHVVGNPWAFSVWPLCIPQSHRRLSSFSSGFLELGARALSFGTREVTAIRRELQAPNPQDILDSITCWLNSLWLLDKLDNSIGRIVSQAKVPAATRCSALASWHDLTVVTTFGHYC